MKTIKIPLGKAVRTALNLPDPSTVAYYYRGVAPYDGPVMSTYASIKEQLATPFNPLQIRNIPVERVDLNLKQLLFRLFRTRHLYYQNGTKVRIKKKYTKRFEFYVGQDQEGNVYWCIGDKLEARRGW